MLQRCSHRQSSKCSTAPHASASATDGSKDTPAPGLAPLCSRPALQRAELCPTS